jgi:hypothetical protein
MPITLNGDTGIQTPMYNGTITANAVTPSVNMKNRIINGAMQINQRGFGATPANFDYLTDRFQFRATQSSKFTSSQSSTAPTGFINSLLFTSSAATTPGSTDQFGVRQFIEGLNISDLAWGTANAKTVTLSFWVRSSLTGTHSGALGNSGDGRAYPFTYTISVADTFEYKTITIAGDTSGTWLTTNGIGIKVNFNLGAGSSMLAAASAWTTGEIVGATGSVNVCATNGATFYITGVQLEVGSTATSFDYRPYGTEFALCQRYYWRLTPNTAGNAGDGGFGSSANFNNTNAYSGIIFPVTMRSAPSGSTAALSDFSYLINGTGLTPTGIDLGSASPQRVEMLVGVSPGSITGGQAGWLRLGSAGFFAFSAEL